MSDYTAPVDDILFTINTVANMPLLATLPGFEEATDDMVNAIVNEAGRKVLDRATGEPLRYNKEDLLNPWFIVE